MCLCVNVWKMCFSASLYERRVLSASVRELFVWCARVSVGLYMVGVWCACGPVRVCTEGVCVGVSVVSPPSRRELLCHLKEFALRPMPWGFHTAAPRIIYFLDGVKGRSLCRLHPTSEIDLFLLGPPACAALRAFGVSGRATAGRQSQYSSICCV